MNEIWVLYAGMAVWIGLGAYAAFLALAGRRIERKVDQLEMLLRDRD